jgi:hypothetical protein
LWHARNEGIAPDPAATLIPTVADGRQGMAFIEAVLRSHQAGTRWVGLP